MSKFAIAQLRHAYAQLAAGTVVDQKGFATGLVGPAIASLEDEAKDDVFTRDEVANMFDWQTSGTYHPFTCENRGDGNHAEVHGELGLLIPTIRGWICPFCDYRQRWAHGMMKGGR